MPDQRRHDQLVERANSFHSSIKKVASFSPAPRMNAAYRTLFESYIQTLALLALLDREYVESFLEAAKLELGWQEQKTLLLHEACTAQNADLVWEAEGRLILLQDQADALAEALRRAGYRRLPR